MIKLIALDMDGTLMSPDHITVSEQNKAALKMAHNKGAKITIATGRTLAIIGDVCQQVPEIDYIIYSNGAGVFDRKAQQSIYTKLMDWSLCESIVEHLDTLPVFLEIYIDGKSYVQQSKAQYFKEGVLPQEFVDKLMGQMTVVENLIDTVRGKSIEKVTIYTCETELWHQLWDKLKQNHQIYLASSLPISMEFTKAGVDKGDALKGMCQALNIKAEECMAFGDAGNDIPMLKFAKYSYAMANGSEECRHAAKHQTKSNGEDGVAFGINQRII